nr:hypothetical protein [Tanacetum cinerariifolium]
MASDSLIFVFSVLSFTLAGIVSCSTLGLAKVVVSMKKVSSRKARSTMGVMSTLVDAFFARFLPPLPESPPFCWISAIGSAGNAGQAVVDFLTLLSRFAQIRAQLLNRYPDAVDVTKLRYLRFREAHTVFVTHRFQRFFLYGRLVETKKYALLAVDSQRQYVAVGVANVRSGGRGALPEDIKGGGPGMRIGLCSETISGPPILGAGAAHCFVDAVGQLVNLAGEVVVADDGQGRRTDTQCRVDKGFRDTRCQGEGNGTVDIIYIQLLTHATYKRLNALAAFRFRNGQGTLDSESDYAQEHGYQER